MALQLRHQTAAEFAARFWARVRRAYQSGRSDEYARLLWWLTERLNAGDLTDAQARQSFNLAYGRTLTAAQWTTLRTNRITPAHDQWQATLVGGDL